MRTKVEPETEEKEIERIHCAVHGRAEKALPSYIIGFDDLLRGGFFLPTPSGSLIVLLKGGPGTGKTTMALQLAVGASRWASDSAVENRPGIDGKVKVYTKEQEAKDLRKILVDRLKTTISKDDLRGVSFNSTSKTLELGGKPWLPRYDEEYKQRSEICIQEPDSAGVCTDDVLSPFSAGYWWVDWVIQELKAETSQLPMVVVDGLNLLSEEERSLLEVERLIEAVRQRSLIGVLIYEGDCQASEHLDYLADMIIELRAEEIDGPPRYFVQKLCIIKSRFQQSVLGWHQYKIRNQTGINVFPSTHFYVHRRGLLNERIEDSMTSLASSSADVKSLNENSKLAHILGGYLGKPALKQGSSTVVLGARRTWKTMLTLDFLRAGSSSESHKEHCLLVSVMDNQSTITNEPRSLCELCCVKGRDKKQREDDCSKHRACYENIYLLHFRPGCISPSEFFHHLHKRLEIGRAIGKPISRLVFWDLTQLEYRFPLIANDRLFIPALIDYLKHSSDPITSVFMGAANSELSRAASAIADNVVFCWRDIRTCDDNGNSVGTTGFVFHVDRLEGHPESGSLFFLSESGDGHIDPVIDSDRQIEAFDYAESMREQIWAMQGLPAKSHSR